MYFFYPEPIKQNAEFHNFYEGNHNDDNTYYLRFIFSFFNCSFEINGNNIFKDNLGNLLI